MGIARIIRRTTDAVADGLWTALDELLREATETGDLDFLREGVRVLGEALMDLEVAEDLGAGKHERTPERTGYRKGYRERLWDTRVGTVELRVPHVRDGSFFPALLEPRRRVERALVRVVQEAYVLGVSTRRFDDLVRALGLTGVSKTQVSRLCQELNREVERVRTRKLSGEYPYVWLDATVAKVRQQGRVVSVSQAVVVAGVPATVHQHKRRHQRPPSVSQAWYHVARLLMACQHLAETRSRVARPLIQEVRC